MKTSIDLNLLAALDALLTERNVTRAGRRIGLSQPAMSEALARLRRHFGDDLLVRVGNKYELTPLGASLQVSSAAVMELVERTFTATHTFDPATCEREFSLLTTDYAAGLLGPHLITAIKEQAPHARLRLRHLAAPQSANALATAARSVDGFLSPRIAALDGFPGVSVFRDRWVCLVAMNNHKAVAPLTVEAMIQLPWVIHELMERHNPVLDSLRAYGLAPDIELVVGDYRLLPDLVRGSSRLSVVQERLLAYTTVESQLRVLELPFHVPPLVETFWWHPAHNADPSHHWFRGVVAAAGRQVNATKRPSNARNRASR